MDEFTGAATSTTVDSALPSPSSLTALRDQIDSLYRQPSASIVYPALDRQALQIMHSDAEPPLMRLPVSTGSDFATASDRETTSTHRKPSPNQVSSAIPTDACNGPTTLDSKDKDVDDDHDMAIKVVVLDHWVQRSARLKSDTLDTPFSHISTPQLEACLDLFMANMADMYRQSSWGLNKAQKRRDFKHPQARFILLQVKPTAQILESNIQDDFEPVVASKRKRKGRGKVISKSKQNKATAHRSSGNIDSTLAAFVHYRWDIETFDSDDTESGETSENKIENCGAQEPSGNANSKQCTERPPPIPVLFVYELQVAQAYRGMGLGSYLMQCMESIAAATRMNRVMLTVFHLLNQPAYNFYKRLGYRVDETSPSQLGDANADYEMLSKAVE
jgi:ribosomal protein S18 acetylase RimI-like enzyme